MENNEKQNEQKGEQIALETRQQQPVPEGWEQKYQQRQSRIEDRWRFVEYED